jgi:hypothetical protein
MVKASFARLDAFARGQIVALAGKGFKAPAIRKAVLKKDGLKPTPRAVRDTIAKWNSNPEWRGENHSQGSGRRRIIDAVLQKRITRLVFKKRGSAVVTVKYIKKVIPKLRPIPRWTVSRSLQDAGLQWLRRRSKKWLSDDYREGRQAYARWIKRCADGFLKSFAYIDGTTFFLARGEAEKNDQKRRALGPFVWRMSTQADGLYRDTVGPSLYAAKQGKPVKVWGFLANGRLCIHVLPLADDSNRTTHMNGPAFREMMTEHAATWKRRCWPNRAPAVVHLIQDHERCLWQEESLACTKSLGLPVVRRYPKSSPDLNPIEQVWSLLRTYLEERAPAYLETREAFLARLRGAVAHLNASKRDVLLRMCRDQKVRAEEVLENEGARIDR